MTTALTVYRRSQLEDADCLWRWRKVWIDGVDDSSDYSLRGQAFAHIKYLYISRLLAANVEADAEEAQAAFIQGIAEHQTPQRLIPELRELWMRHAEVFSLDRSRYLAHEERQVGQGLSFNPDLVYAHPGELEILDDKTFYSMFTETEAKNSFQGRFYIHEARERWPGFDSYRMTFVFVRFNKVVSVVYTPAELDQIEQEIAAARARIEYAKATNNWPAVAGPSCRYCELSCPVADEKMRLPVRLTSEQATHVASWVLVADKAMKTVKKALKAYASVNGPITVGDVVFDHRPVIGRSYPVEVVTRLLKQYGVDTIEDIKHELTISHSSLKKVFKHYPDLQRDLAPYVIEKETSRFSGRRAGGDDETESDE